MKEINIKNLIRLEAAKVPGLVIFNNAVGQAWAGKAVPMQDGSVIIYNPYRVTYGLAPGSADLIGWRSVEIMPEHVGRRVAIFTAIEVKTKDGRLSEEQEHFLHKVREAGGIAFELRDPEALEEFFE